MHTQLVRNFIGTHIGFMFHLIHVYSYGAMHAARV